MAHGQGSSQGASDNDDVGEEPQNPEPLGNPGPQNPLTPVRPRSSATQHAQNAHHHGTSSPSSMSPFVPHYNNSDGYGSVGTPGSSPNLAGFAGHLHPRANRMPLGRSGMSSAPTMPMAPMDEEELPPLAGLHTASPYDRNSPVVPGQSSEVNSSPPIQLPQGRREQSAIEDQAAGASMSVQGLLNSSPVKQQPLPQAYQSHGNNGYGFQDSHSYNPNYAQGLAQGYGNGYSQNYTPSYGPAYSQGYNNAVQSYGQGYDSSPNGLPQIRTGNDGYQNYGQGFESSPQGYHNAGQGYNLGYDSSPQVHNNNVVSQGYDSSPQGNKDYYSAGHGNQGYNSSPSGHHQARAGNESFAAQIATRNATRSAHKAETYDNDHRGSSSNNGYQDGNNGYPNGNVPKEEEEQSAVYSSGAQQSPNGA